MQDMTSRPCQHKGPISGSAECPIICNPVDDVRTAHSGHV